MADSLQPESALPMVTSARLGLGLTGPAIPTREHLRFALDHALARDAVHAPLDVNGLLRDLEALGLSALTVRSAATDRATYLRRPDLGRKLHPASRELLEQQQMEPMPSLTVLLADGLSARAVEQHAVPLLRELQQVLDPTAVSLGAVVIGTHARVALGDEVGHLLNASAVLVMIGERPGLSSPDSLGAYLTWAPRPGRTDAERNCISNIRTEGLSYAVAAHRLAYFLREAQRLQATGILLKDPDSSHLARLPFLAPE